MREVLAPISNCTRQGQGQQDESAEVTPRVLLDRWPIALPPTVHVDDRLSGQDLTVAGQTADSGVDEIAALVHLGVPPVIDQGAGPLTERDADRGGVPQEVIAEIVSLAGRLHVEGQMHRR